MPDDDRFKAIFELIRIEAEDKDKLCLEIIGQLIEKFRANPGTMLPRELMELIWHASARIKSLELKGAQEKQFDSYMKEGFDSFMNALPFTKLRLDRSSPDSLTNEWKNFRTKAAGSNEFVEDTADDIVALWYFSEKKWLHAVAVYEYIYQQIRGMELVDDQHLHGVWTFQLWTSCVKARLSRRAIELSGRVREYFDDGAISLETWEEFLTTDSDLRYVDMQETIIRDRNLAQERLHIEHGPLMDRLDNLTKKFLVDAELWSDPRMRKIEPSAGPQRWALAVESEFNKKVFLPNRRDLNGAFEEPIKEERTCGLGQISHLLKSSASKPFIRAMLKKLYRGDDLMSYKNFDFLEVMKEHRHQIAHITSNGPYTLERCNEFIERLRDSGWIFEFLEKLQPSK